MGSLAQTPEHPLQPGPGLPARSLWLFSDPLPLRSARAYWAHLCRVRPLREELQGNSMSLGGGFSVGSPILSSPS